MADAWRLSIQRSAVIPAARLISGEEEIHLACNLH
jgi:hypothetical protein